MPDQRYPSISNGVAAIMLPLLLAAVPLVHSFRLSSNHHRLRRHNFSSHRRYTLLHVFPFWPCARGEASRFFDIQGRSVTHAPSSLQSQLHETRHQKTRKHGQRENRRTDGEAEGKATENVTTSREASINKMETTSKIKKGERQGISTKQAACQATTPPTPQWVDLAQVFQNSRALLVTFGASIYANVSHLLLQ